MLRRQLTIVALAVAALLPIRVAAQSDPVKEELRRQIGASLNAVIGDSPQLVVEKVIAIKPDGAISRNFDLGKVATALFGRLALQVAPDCRATSTVAKEPDSGLCIVDNGNRDGGGVYTMLAFSKNIGIGDIQFVRRAASKPDGETLPTPVKLTDEDAYAQALKFLDLVGVPRSEIPAPPKGFLPVRSLVVGAVDEKGTKTGPFSIQKVVSLPRAFVVPGGFPWLKDPRTGQVLSHVIAPGGASVALNDGAGFNGVQFASVDGWSDAQIDPKIDSRNAKSAAALRDEITDDLYAEGVRKAGTLSILIALRRAYPNPDDPNPPLCPVCGLLLPAVQVIVSQPGPGKFDSSETNWAAPGVVREYDLVNRSELERPAR